MPLAANALVDLATAKAFLNITGTADDAKLETVINRATMRCERYTNRPLKAKAYSNLRFVGRPTLEFSPLHVPIDTAAVVTVSVDGAAQTVWKTEVDGDPELKDVVVMPDLTEPVLAPYKFHRRSEWGNGRELNVLLSYTGGFATIPEDLQLACLYVIQRYWRDQQKQLADITTLTMPSGSITLLDIVLPREARGLLAGYARTVMA